MTFYNKHLQFSRSFVTRLSFFLTKIYNSVPSFHFIMTFDNINLQVCCFFVTKLWLFIRKTFMSVAFSHYVVTFHVGYFFYSRL